jgi:hypothetical protein
MSDKKRNISDKIGRENHNTFFVHQFIPENRVFYEIMWKYRQATHENVIWRMPFAYRITMSTDTHTQHM